MNELTQQSEIGKLMQFYDAHDLQQLALGQANHIERLQQKLSSLTPNERVRFNPPREG